MKWWQLKKKDADLERELRSDLELEQEEQRERGLSEEDARYAARRAFGNATLIREQTHEAWGWASVEHVWQDVRYAARQLRRSPGFSAVVVLILGLGIGANCTIFSFVDAVLLKPLRVPHPERLIRIYARGPSGHYGAGFSYPEFEYLRGHDSSFRGLAIEAERPQLHMVVGDTSTEIRGEFVSANYFPLLEIEPRLGRGFLPEEDASPGRDPVAVISDRMWIAWFNRDPSVLGRLVSINSISFKIVGVAMPGFEGDLQGLPVDVWMPSMMYGAAGYGCDDGSFNCSLFDSMIGVLTPGSSPARAQAESGSTMTWSATDWPERPSRRQIAVVSASRQSPDNQAEDAAQLRLLAGVTASLLLIVCVNLAGMLVVRGLMRRKEVAIRLSIGAATSRIVRQLLTENLVLASLGGMLGVGLSFAGKQIVSDFYSTDSEGFRHLYDLAFDWRVLVYSIGLTVGAGIFFGLLPALRALRHDLITDLKDSGLAERHSSSSAGAALVIGQIGISIVLVIASALLIRSASEIRKGTNFDPENALVLRLRPELLKYTPQQVSALVRRVYQRLSAVPQVESLAFMQGGEGLVWDWRSGREVQISTSAQTLDQSRGLQVRKQDVSRDFFRTMKIPLLQGREFGDQDLEGAPAVAVINEALAQRLQPANAAVGHTIFVNGRPFQIIGICADLQPPNPMYAPEPHLYLSYWQSNATREGDIRLVFRAHGDAGRLLPFIRRAIQSVDPNVPVGEDMPLAEQVRLEYRPLLLAQKVMTFCGLFALCLSTLGLYSIIAFSVRARGREIAIRMALGARRQDVLALFVAQGARLAIAGVLAGGVAALMTTRLLATLLYGIKATDPAVHFFAAVLLFLVAIAACFVPAMRAASIDPAQTLRSE
jgi:predicted permease